MLALPGDAGDSVTSGDVSFPLVMPRIGRGGSEVPELEQSGPQAGEGDPVVGPEPGIGVPEVGEGLLGVRHRDRVQVRSAAQEVTDGAAAVEDRDRLGIHDGWGVNPLVVGGDENQVVPALEAALGFVVVEPFEMVLRCRPGRAAMPARLRCPRVLLGRTGCVVDGVPQKHPGDLRGQEPGVGAPAARDPGQWYRPTDLPLDWKWHRFVLSEIACELVIQPGLGSPLLSRWDSVRVGTTLTSKVALTCVV